MSACRFSLRLAFFLSWVLQAQAFGVPEEAIRKIFPQFQEAEQARQTLGRHEIEVFTLSGAGRLIGWAVVLEEPAKRELTRFLIGIDAQGRVAGVAVLDYRDIFGAEIRRRSFLRQFLGKSVADPLKVGGDVDAVTGATISSNAAAAAVRKALAVVKTLCLDGEEIV